MLGNETVVNFCGSNNIRFYGAVVKAVQSLSLAVTTHSIACSVRRPTFCMCTINIMPAAAPIKVVFTSAMVCSFTGFLRILTFPPSTSN